MGIPLVESSLLDCSDTDIDFDYLIAGGAAARYE